MSLSEAIYKTIAYARDYGGGLSDEELGERLLGPTVYTFDEVLRYLDSNPKLRKEAGKKRPAWQKEKMRKAEKFVSDYLEKNSFVMMAGVSGSVAAGYPKEDDDIDLLIVTKRNRLWWTRLTVKLQLLFNRIPHRQKGSRERKDELCFNLWLDEDGLTMPAVKRNQKNAVDLILMKPILDRNGMYSDFIRANDWAKEFVATGYHKINRPHARPGAKGNINPSMLLLNRIAYLGQLMWMKRKKRREVVNVHQAFFHPHG